MITQNDGERGEEETLGGGGRGGGGGARPSRILRSAYPYVSYGTYYTRCTIKANFPHNPARTYKTTLTDIYCYAV